jgi:hypothetical protein
MSHFTHIKTRFQNLVYLEKALNLLNIHYQKLEGSNENLIIEHPRKKNMFGKIHDFVFGKGPPASVAY